MDQLRNQIIGFILGGGALSFITAIITMRYTKKQAEANAMSAMQNVYQELIEDLRKDRDDMKVEKINSDKRWLAKIEALEEKQSKMELRIHENDKQISELKKLTCMNLACTKRYQS